MLKINFSGFLSTRENKVFLSKTAVETKITIFRSAHVMPLSTSCEPFFNTEQAELTLKFLYYLFENFFPIDFRLLHSYKGVIITIKSSNEQCLNTVMGQIHLISLTKVSYSNVKNQDLRLLLVQTLDTVVCVKVKMQ